VSAAETGDSGPVESITVTEYARRIGGGWRDGSPTGSGLWTEGGQIHAIIAPGSNVPVVVKVVDDGGEL